MRKRKFFLFVLAAVMIFSVCLPVQAGGMNIKKEYGMSQKVFSKMHKMLMNKEALALTGEQIQQIKDLKIALKKEIIKLKADIDIIGVDIKAKMWEDVIDAKEVEALIDKKYELKKTKAKSLVRACVKLQTVLNKEQAEKLKSICQKNCRLK